MWKTREVGLAVLADLERHLGGAAACSPSWSRRAHARGEVVEAQAVELAAAASAFSALNGNRVRPSPASRAAVELVRAVALERAHEEVARGPRGRRPCTTARQRSESLSQASTSGLGTRSGNCASSSSTGLATRGSRGHAPVLAPPVEPAPGQLLDRLVQVLVERGSRRRAPARADCPRAARPAPRRAQTRAGVGSTAKQTSLAATEAFATGAPRRRRAARRAARPPAPGRARRTRALRGPSSIAARSGAIVAGMSSRSGSTARPAPTSRDAAGVLGLVGEQRDHHERHAGGERAEGRAGAAVHHRGRRVRRARPAAAPTAPRARCRARRAARRGRGRGRPSGARGPAGPPPR